MTQKNGSTTGGDRPQTMKRVLTAAALVLLFNPIQATAFEMRNECRYKKLGGPSWSIQNVRDTAHCAARRNHIAVTKFLSVVDCESGFQAFPGGYYHGPMQYLASTFRTHYGYFPRYVGWHQLRRDVDRPRANIMIGARYVAAHGYGPWGCA